VSRHNLEGGRKGPASASTEVSEIPRQLDLRLHDRVALDEIELYAEVLTAVAATDRPLTRTELDAVLGVSQGSLGDRSSTVVHDIRVPAVESQVRVHSPRRTVVLIDVEHNVS
jgi:hypothetical protein